MFPTVFLPLGSSLGPGCRGAGAVVVRGGSKRLY